MAGNIKGLTVEIGGDTTKLGKALEGVEKQSKGISSELGQINKLLKMDPGNTNLLAQKYTVLEEAIATTKEKLDTLKKAEQQVQEQFERGEVSAEQVRALKREIIATENKLNSYEKAAQETAEAMDKFGTESKGAGDEVDEAGDEAKKAAKKLDDLGDSARDAEGGLGAAAVAAGTFIGNLAEDALTGAADWLKDSVEASHEYRTALGKLEVAFDTAGHSSEAATQTYQALQGVLGETDQAVEAANHLAKLCDSEQDLATWTDIATGVYATFGDSLPIEGLTEAA